MLQPDVDNLQREVVVLVLEAEHRQVDVVFRDRRVEPCGFPKRVIRLLDACGIRVRARDETVELRAFQSLRQELGRDADRGLTVAGIDQHERLVVPGRVDVGVAVLSRLAEKPRRFRVRAVSPQRHSRVEPAPRLVEREPIEDCDGLRRPPLLEQTGGVVEHDGWLLHDPREALLVVWQRQSIVFALEVDLADMLMRDLIVGRLAQDALEVAEGRVRPAAPELVDRQVPESGREVGIDCDRGAESDVGGIGLARSGQRNPEQVESLEVARGTSDQPLQRGDGRGKFLALHLGNRAVVRRRRAIRRRLECRDEGDARDPEQHCEQGRAHRLRRYSDQLSAVSSQLDCSGPGPSGQNRRCRTES